MQVTQSHRGTIFLDNARVLTHDHVQADQHILRVHAPQVAATARPGSFAHVRCAEHLPMRRPLSIMRVDVGQGWVEFLYKNVGVGTAALATAAPDDILDVLGPIGQGFTLNDDRSRPVLIGGGVGIPPMVFLADILRQRPHAWPVVFMGSEVAFPFPVKPSEILLEGTPAQAIACLPLLDDWGIPSRLASGQGFPGCFDGHVTELAGEWLSTLGAEALGQVQIFACGPTPMLKAAARLARQFALPAQLCLEEYMVCAVGGCAGCVVPVHTAQGIAMKRVCVDGPVFEAESVYPQPAHS
ncbi:MAG: dihydroorotate dehydrogenase electron transfer subunit [Gammaproteobacteria bacterium]|jgi:dihydroorotate dehydrogenase electron transfer subunit